MRERVLLADDHTIVLEGMRRLLEPEYTIVATVQDGRALVEAADRLRPDVIVTDIAMPLLNGIEALRQLQKADLRAKIVLMTMHASVSFAVEAIRMGASAYVLKHDAVEDLSKAIRAALSGQLYVTPSIADDVHDALAQGGSRASRAAQGRIELTPREREVLQLVAEGHTAKEIASILGISPRTAEHHRYNLMDKLKLHTVAALTRYAVDQGIVPPMALDPGDGS